MPSNRKLSATAPLPVLVTELARLGWGPLAGPSTRAMTVILAELAADHRIDPTTGSGTITVRQVAAIANYRPRWTTHTLHAMDALGLIRHRRGGLAADGTPIPGGVTVVKSMIWALILAARPLAAAAARRARLERAERMQQIRSLVAVARAGRYPNYRSRRSGSGAVGASLSPLRGSNTPPVGTSRARRGWEIPDLCVHESVLGACGSCRRDADFVGAALTGAGAPSGVSVLDRFDPIGLLIEA